MIDKRGKQTGNKISLKSCIKRRHNSNTNDISYVYNKCGESSNEGTTVISMKRVCIDTSLNT